MFLAQKGRLVLVERAAELQPDGEWAGESPVGHQQNLPLSQPWHLK